MVHDCDCNAGEEPDISKLSKQSPSLSIEKRRPIGRLLNQIGRYAQRPSLPRFGIAFGFTTRNGDGRRRLPAGRLCGFPVD